MPKMAEYVFLKATKTKHHLLAKKQAEVILA